MKRPTDWLWVGIAILAADLILRHTLGGPGFFHIVAFVVGGAAVAYGIAMQLARGEG